MAKRKASKSKSPAHWQVAEPGEPAREPEAADVGDTGDPSDAGDSRPVHAARCMNIDCDAGVQFRALPSGVGFTVLERYGVDVDTTFGISDRGLPLCPRGHGEMQLEDEQLPVAEAFAQVAAAVNGNAPTQAQLFEIAQPFNFEGAWMDIESKQAEVDELATVHEDDAATAKKSKKALEEAQTLLGRMINVYHDRRLKKLREQLEQAERVGTPVIVDEVRGESFDRDRMGETGDTLAAAHSDAVEA